MGKREWEEERWWVEKESERGRGEGGEKWWGVIRRESV